MDEEIAKLVESGKIGPRDDAKVRARLLADDFGWDVSDARKIWCFVSHACHFPPHMSDVSTK